MASSVSINTSGFRDRAFAYIGKVRASSLIAIEKAQQYILEEALMRAPTPEQEQAAVESWQAAGEVKQGNPDLADNMGERQRFLKGPGQFYIQEVLNNPSLHGAIFTPYDTQTRVGFNFGNLEVLDQLTKFSWVNAEVVRGSVETYGPFESKYGTFHAFEYGYSFYIFPVNAKTLSPEPGVHVMAARKSIPAYGMFTSILPWAVLEIMNGIISEVQFNED